VKRVYRFMQWVFVAAVVAFLGLFVLAVAGCSTTETTVTSYARGGLPIGSFKSTNVIYGKSQIDSTLFGVTHISNLDVGFKYLAQAITALTTAYIAGDVQKAQEVTTQLAAAGATKAQIATIQAKAAADAAAQGADLTKFGISHQLFKPEAATFTQPKL